MKDKALFTFAGAVLITSSFAECETLREWGAANNLLIGSQFKYAEMQDDDTYR